MNVLQIILTICVISCLYLIGLINLVLKDLVSKKKSINPLLKMLLMKKSFAEIDFVFTLLLKLTLINEFTMQ